MNSNDNKDDFGDRQLRRARIDQIVAESKQIGQHAVDILDKIQKTRAVKELNSKLEAVAALDQLRAMDEERHLAQDVVWHELEKLRDFEEEQLDRIAAAAQVETDLAAERRVLIEQLEFARGEVAHTEEALGENSETAASVRFKLGALNCDLTDVRRQLNEKVDLCKTLQLILLNEDEWRRTLDTSLAAQEQQLAEFNAARQKKRREAEEKMTLKTAEEVAAQKRLEEEKAERLKLRGEQRATQLVEDALAAHDMAMERKHQQQHQEQNDNSEYSPRSLLNVTILVDADNRVSAAGSRRASSAGVPAPAPAATTSVLARSLTPAPGGASAGAAAPAPVAAATPSSSLLFHSPSPALQHPLSSHNNSTNSAQSPVDGLHREIRLLRNKVAALTDMNSKSAGRYASLRAKYEAATRALAGFRLSARETTFLTQNSVLAELETLRSDYRDLYLLHYRTRPPDDGAGGVSEMHRYDPKKDPEAAFAAAKSASGAAGLRQELEVLQQQSRDMVLQNVELKEKIRVQRRAMQAMEADRLFAHDHLTNGRFADIVKLQALEEQMRHVVHHSKIQDPVGLKQNIAELQESLANLRALYEKQKEVNAEQSQQLALAEARGFGQNGRKFVDCGMMAVPQSVDGALVVSTSDAVRLCTYDAQTSGAHLLEADLVVLAPAAAAASNGGSTDQHHDELSEEEAHVVEEHNKAEKQRIAAENRIGFSFLRALSRAVEVVECSSSSQEAAKNLESFVFGGNNNNTSNKSAGPFSSSSSSSSSLSALLMPTMMTVRAKRRHSLAAAAAASASNASVRAGEADSGSASSKRCQQSPVFDDDGAEDDDRYEIRLKIEVADAQSQCSPPPVSDARVNTDPPPLKVDRQTQEAVHHFARGTMTTPPGTRDTASSTIPVEHCNAGTQATVQTRDVMLQVLRPPPRRDVQLQVCPRVSDFCMITDSLPIRHMDVQTDPIPRPVAFDIGLQFRTPALHFSMQTDPIPPPPTGRQQVQTDAVEVYDVGEMERRLGLQRVRYETALAELEKRMQVSEMQWKMDQLDMQERHEKELADKLLLQSLATDHPCIVGDVNDLQLLEHDPLQNTSGGGGGGSNSSHSRPASAIRRQFSRPSSGDAMQKVPLRISSFATSNSAFGDSGRVDGSSSALPRPASAHSARLQSAGGSVVVGAPDGGGDHNSDGSPHSSPLAASLAAWAQNLLTTHTTHTIGDRLTATLNSSASERGSSRKLRGGENGNFGAGNDDDDDENLEQQFDDIRNENGGFLTEDEQEARLKKERERRIEESIYLRLRLTQNALSAAESRAQSASERYQLLRQALSSVYDLYSREVTDHELVTLTTELQEAFKKRGGDQQQQGGPLSLTLERLRKKAGVGNVKLRLHKAVVNASQYKNFADYVEKKQERDLEGDAERHSEFFRYAFQSMSRRLPVEDRVMHTPSPHREAAAANFGKWMSAATVDRKKLLDFVRDSRHAK